jgi:hypothetical protein
MERRFGAKLDPTMAAVDRESRSFRRIQGGDAAKAAEDSTEEATLSQGSFGISLRATRGARFEVEKQSEGQEDTLPLPGLDASGQNIDSVKPEEPQTEESASGITRKLFRKLLRP